jgi:fucose 4-O-acetylase-like acetyltransferase
VSQRAAAQGPRTADERPAGTPGGAVPASKVRDPHLDNVKVILLALVVIGHTTGYLSRTDVPLARDLYYWMYLFHMPAFVALTGLLSRWEVLDGRRAGSLVTKLLLPYALFSVIYDYWAHWTLGNPVELRLDVPQLHLWYLVSVACWRAATPMLLRLRYPLVIAVLLSLLAPLSEHVGLFLSISRTFGYLPFFVLGLVVPRTFPRRLTHPAVRAGSVLLLGATLLAVMRWSSDEGGYPSWLYWTAPYERMHQSALDGIVWRAGLIALGIALTAAVVSLAPRRARWWTVAGTFSIYPYLLHVLLIRLYWASPLYDATDTLPELLLVIVCCIAVVPLLALPWVRAVARPVVEPSARWLVRRE